MYQPAIPHLRRQQRFITIVAPRKGERAKGVHRQRKVMTLYNCAVTVDMILDWDGSAAQCTCTAYDGDGSTFQVDNLAVDSYNDVVLLDGPLSSEEGMIDVVRFVRGPDNPAIPFAIKAIPINWLVADVEATLADPALVATRGVHYEYADGVEFHEDVQFTWSTDINGSETCFLQQSTAEYRYYEIWFCIRSPLNPDVHLLQDPIVRTGNHTS